MKMVKPFVSIIIPVYRVSKYIERCLRSVMQQQGDIAMECILVDDCSPDDSMDIVKRLLDDYDGPITFHTESHKQNLGLSAARNTGMTMAQGDYLFFIDSDDYITDDCLQRLTDVVKKNPEVQVVKGNHVGNGGVIHASHIPQVPLGNDTLLDLIYMGIIPVMAWNTLIRRSLVEKNGLSFRQGLMYEDNLWSVQLFRCTVSFVFVHDETYYYEENPNSISGAMVGMVQAKHLSHMVYIIDELLNTFDAAHFIPYTCFINTRLMQMLDCVDNDNTIDDGIRKHILQQRNHLIKYALSHCRIVLALFELLLYKPFRMLYRFRLFRRNYNRIETVVCRFANVFDNLHAKRGLECLVGEHMKIVYVYPSLAIFGGIERILIDKMNFLAREYGEEVYIITSDQGLHSVPYHLDERVHFMDLNIRFHTQYRYGLFRRQWVRWRMFREYDTKLLQALSVIQPDVLVCTSAHHVRRLLKVKGRTPLVVESHINFIHPDSMLHQVQKRMNNYWIGKAEAVVTLTEGDAEDWRRVSKHVHVIPNIVHLNDTNLYSDCTAKRVLFVGRFEEQKNIGELISIWQLIHPKFPDWKLDLYGDGALWEKYKQEADALNINIEIHKPTAQIMDVYCNSSIFVLTSLFEPFGLVIPEAMSCGLPVVSYDSPYGPASIVSEGKDGFIVPLHDRQTFADRLCQLMGDEELRKKMGRHAIASSQRFSADQIMPMWKELFEKLTLS